MPMVGRPNTESDADQPLTLRVQGELERLIMSGELKGGDRINENLLAERFGVSRGPIREACRALTQDGLLHAIPNRGMFVRQVELSEALEVYDIRASLDDLTGRLLAARISDAQLDALARLIDGMDAAAARHDLDIYYPANLEFHDSLLAYAGNRRLARLYRGLVKELHLFRRKGLLEADNMRISNEEHRQVLAALAKRDPIHTGLAMRGHVMAAKQRLMAAAEAHYARP